MIPMIQSRKMLVVAASAIVAMQWLDPSADVHAAEGGQSVSEKRVETHSATERQGKVIQVSADLTHDIDRLEKRGTRSNIYDLFSRRGQTSSAGDSPGQMSSAGRSQTSSAGRSKNKTSGREGRSSGQSARPSAEPAPVAAAAVATDDPAASPYRRSSAATSSPQAAGGAVRLHGETHRDRSYRILSRQGRQTVYGQTGGGNRRILCVRGRSREPNQADV